MAGPSDGDKLITQDDGPEMPTADVVRSAEMPTNLVVLSLDDLLPDPQGEIVILDDAAEGLAIATGGRPIAEHGIAEPHVTATGIDVSGLAYCTFTDGLTLYYSSALKVIVEPDSI